VEFIGNQENEVISQITLFVCNSINRLDRKVNAMVEKHFLISDLEKAEQDSTKDYYLSMSAKHIYTEFFKDKNNEMRWKERLATTKDLDLKRSPLFEAIWFLDNGKLKRITRKE
jgi:hypothetical protein